MLRERPYESYEDYDVVYDDDNLISYKLKDDVPNKKDCDLCNEPHSYILVIKNKTYGYNIRIPLCKTEYNAILESVKSLIDSYKNLN